MADNTTHYLIIRDENGGSIVSEETSDVAACILQGAAFRLWFPEVELHDLQKNGQGPDTYRLIKHNGQVSQIVHETPEN